MIRPTFMGFETAKKGLTTAQKGLDIAGQNLTNWDSVGYTRQRVTQAAVSADTYRTRYASSNVAGAGQGVDIKGIDQVRDVYLDRRFREESGDVGYYSNASNILNDIQNAINEYDPLGDTGLRMSFLNINDALQRFSVNSYSETHANIVATEFKSLAQTLQQISVDLADTRSQQVYNMEVSVQDVNKKLQQIAELNKNIMESESIISNAYFGPNELLDERNLLLDELSQYVDMSYETNADGSLKVTVNGHVAVDGSKYDKLDVTRDENTDVIGINWVSTGQAAPLTTGTLKASLNYINGRGPNLQNPGESTEYGFLYYQDKLDTLAREFAQVVNNIIPEVDENGDIKKDAEGNILYRKLMGAMAENPDANGVYNVDPNEKITASNIAITNEWSNNSNYIIFQSNEDGTAENVANYALAMAEALSEGTHVFDNSGELFQGTFLDYIKGYVTTLAEDISFVENRSSATSTIATSLQDSRDSVSGVVVDEEVANVMLYQKSLSAASRLMTAMDEALDVIVNKTGLVGR